MFSASADPDPIKGDTSPEGLLKKPADDFEPEMTLQQSPTRPDEHQNDESCLVQIYPADVVGGMLLIESDHLLIGRDAGADLVLPDTSVSRQHAKIIRTVDGFQIQDLGSTNGTFVDGAPIEISTLRAGATIRLGSFLFKFLSAGSVESQYHETVYSALTRDALTGTMNKRYLLETLRRAMATAIRQKKPRGDCDDRHRSLQSGQ